MTYKLKYANIRPDNINTFYYDKISVDTAQKRLRTLNNLGYNRYVLELIDDYNMEPIEISNTINQPVSAINRFLYHNKIPEYILHLASLNDASNTLLNKIASSQVLNEAMRILLFTRAVKSKNNPLRFKERQFEHVKIFCSNITLTIKERKDPNFNASLLEKILAGDTDLVSNWQDFLIKLRGARRTNDYFNQYNYYNADNNQPLQ